MGGFITKLVGFFFSRTDKKNFDLTLIKVAMNNDEQRGLDKLQNTRHGLLTL